MPSRWAKRGGLETTDDRVFITIRHAEWQRFLHFLPGGRRYAFPVERIEAMGAGRSAVDRGLAGRPALVERRCEKFSGEEDKGIGRNSPRFSGLP